MSGGGSRRRDSARVFNIFETVQKGDLVTLLKHKEYNHDDDIYALLIHKNDDDTCVDPNGNDSITGYTALQLAVKGCYPKIVSVLLRCPGIDINTRTADGSKTALHVAVTANGSPQSLLKIVQYLLVNGADIRAKVREIAEPPQKKKQHQDDDSDEDDEVTTPLNTAMRLACAQMPRDIMDLLLNHPKSTKQDDGISTLLRVAIENDNLDALAALIDYGNLANVPANIDEDDADLAEMPKIIEKAAKHGNIAILKYLFQNYQKAIKRSMVGHTIDAALEAAVTNPECLRFLLEKLCCNPCRCVLSGNGWCASGPYHMDTNRAGNMITFRAVSKAIDKRVDLATLEMLLDHIPKKVIDLLNNTDPGDFEDMTMEDGNPVFRAAECDDKRYMDALARRGFNPKLLQVVYGED